MSRLIAVLLVAVVAVIALLTWDRKPPWRSVPSPAGLSYKVQLRTYEDGHYADQPFDLQVLTMDRSSSRLLLTASQCKNVLVAPTDHALYVFYEDIVVSHFAASGSDVSRPRPILCDLRYRHCAERLKSFRSNNISTTQVCTFP